MSALLLLVPLSVLLLAVAIWAVLRAIDRGQFDDLETPALAPLREDDAPPPDPPAPRDTTR